ncbi:polysaccharide biosynthesis/export family protein [uncultured Litoreibacter sp.]|uniref:polysaccharide biosynthesis/export family protein n=1 Tax=uncultured Litoreibacter sp. TaxID=1392394 RepID=UPI00262B3D56|nr:polysaccharide biosynthesis/export family protein [uncultured Litoreibacter sp.]
MGDGALKVWNWFLFAIVMCAGPVIGKSYELRSGDMLRIEVIEDSSLNRNALVLPDGTIAFPMVGQVKAAGLTLHQLRETLTDGLAPNFAQRPNLHVAVASVAKNATRRVASKAVSASPPRITEKLISVFGMGELAKPGKLQMPEKASLMQFLAQAGGTTPYAALKRVQIRRTNPDGEVMTYRVNLKKLMRGSGQVFELAPGDVVIVPERKLFE